MSDTLDIAFNTIIKRNDIKFLANSLGDEMVMMNLENGDFISMNRVGADIWNLSQEAISLDELIKKLLTVYNTTSDQCAAETFEFLKAAGEQNMFLFSRG